MRSITNCLRAALISSLFTALPGVVRAQSWQWVIAPASTASGSVAIAATALDGADNTVVAGYFTGTITLGATTLASVGRPAILACKPWLITA